MAFKSHWEENKEMLVNKALVDYKEKDCPSAGYDIIRYTNKGVIGIKTEFQDLAQKMFSEQPCNNSKYIILRLAKLGALEWNDGV